MRKKLNIFFTAGVPNLEDTTNVIQLIEDSGADMIEIGIPYSDPVADGPVIQQADELALKNGMTIDTLFKQLETLKGQIRIPMILMGYLNPVLKFGFEKFCSSCKEVGITGLILPDLPPIEFENKYKNILQKYNIQFSFLVTPETSLERILYLDGLSTGFLYAVSASSTTGNNSFEGNQPYFERLRSLPLKNPVMIGFGIKDKNDFETASEHFYGGIIGSAFVKILLENKDWKTKAEAFINDIRS